jgi:DNA repair photolyase
VTTRGTKEWAETNVNFAKGCSNGCKYCYARQIGDRFGWKKSDDWENMEVVPEKVNKNYQNFSGRVMIPSSHDITLEIIDSAIQILTNLVKVGNELLIVSKPNIDVVKRLCDELSDFRDQVEFRFTITSTKKSISRKYEPNAPNPGERYDSLVHAFSSRYRTSVSVEPFLEHPLHVILEVQDFAESIWVGPMNQAVCQQLCPELWKPELWSQTALIKIKQHIEYHLDVIQHKIRYKDSFLHAIPNTQSLLKYSGGQT